MLSDHNVQLNLAQNGSNHDREKELKAFDESKTGVKGLVDAGIVKVPPIFVIPSNETSSYKRSYSVLNTSLQIPVIDLKDMNEDGARRSTIIEEIRKASETWRFFQVANHGMPGVVLDEMIEGIRGFNEQPDEAKIEYYSRDNTKKVKFNSNFDLYQTKAANWRDTLFCVMAPDGPNPQELPPICRDIICACSAEMRKLGVTLLEILAEALGLNPNHLNDMECAKGHSLACHYYPACPEPDQTLGTSPHSDPDFFTILLQDRIGGLQVSYKDEWVDIPPIKDTLVVNLGDLLQLISNDKFKSAKHRVVANKIGPRISVACFFRTNFQPFGRIYAPIQELLSDTKPPLFRGTTVEDYVTYYNSKGLCSTPALDHFRL